MSEPTVHAPAEHITVVIPTWNRAEILPNCLAGLAAQHRAADRIVAVVRPSDHATRSLLAAHPEVDIADVHEPGFVPALNAGAAAVTHGIIVYTDDDAVPRPGWLAGIEAHFSRDPHLTGVGGRDVINGIDVAPERRKLLVGATRLGRPVGNHHLGAGPPREVQVLKGVNAGYRRSHLPKRPFDARLRGSGGHHNELALGNHLISQGRRLLYDPDLVVDHYPAERADGWRTGSLDAGRDEAFNEQLAFAPRSPGVRAAVLFWGLTAGTPKAPGLLRAARDAHDYEEPVKRLLESVRARIAGARSSSYEAD